MWTFALTMTGVAGLWAIPHHWWGWLLYLLNESLWLAYGLTTGSHPVIVMSCIWGALGVRNLIVSRHAEGKQQGPPDGQQPGQERVPPWTHEAGAYARTASAATWRHRERRLSSPEG
jgi:hypothetical protein